MTGALISSDSPDWWQLSPATAVNPPSSRYAKLNASKTLRGIAAIEMNIIGMKDHPRTASSSTRFDPMTSTNTQLSNVPDKPGRQEKLYALELNQPRARLQDPLSFNSRHRDVIEKEKRAFFRTKGEGGGQGLCLCCGVQNERLTRNTCTHGQYRLHGELLGRREYLP